MSDTPTAMTDADYAVHIAELLGDPLPDDWQDALAVEARQDHLAAVAHIAGEMVLGVFTDIATAVREGTPRDRCHDMLAPIAGEVAALDQAMRRYTHDTQRRDASPIVRAALDDSAGATIAAMLLSIIDRWREAERATPVGQGEA